MAPEVTATAAHPSTASAVVVIDCQNDYCHSDGAFARRGVDVRPLQTAARRSADLVDWAHSASLPCIFVLTEHSDWFDTPGWRGRGRAGRTLDVQADPIAQAGSWGAEPFGVKPTAADLVVTKHRYSAFAYTPLELALRARAVDDVIFAGVTTNVCVRLSVLDATMRGWRPVVVSDCTAATTPDEHEQALREFTDYAGTVSCLDDLMSDLPDSCPPTRLERSL